MSMTATEIQQVRSVPLFADLPDGELGFLQAGEIINAPIGTVLGVEGERTGLFQVLEKASCASRAHTIASRFLWPSLKLEITRGKP